MEIKVQKNNVKNYGLSFTKTEKNNENSFSSILNQAVNNSSSSQLTVGETDILKNIDKTGNPLIDNLPEGKKGKVLGAINNLNRIFSINILGDPNQFINKDSTINMPRILAEYGTDVKSSELEDLSKSINTLAENGLISNEDYFYALKWIETKQQSFKIKMNSEKNKASVCDLMWKPKKKETNDLL